MDICAFCYMLNLLGVMVLHKIMVNRRRGKGSVCHGYMCILLYMTLIWCSGFPQIYGQLEWGGLGICVFFYMYNLFSVMLLQRSVFDWRGVHLPWVYVYSAICKTYSV